METIIDQFWTVQIIEDLDNDSLDNMHIMAAVFVEEIPTSCFISLDMNIISIQCLHS